MHGMGYSKYTNNAKAEIILQLTIIYIDSSNDKHIKLIIIS